MRYFSCCLLTLIFAATQILAQTENRSDERKNGTHFLSPQLQALQNDVDKNPAQLWVERGTSLWQGQCASCHGAIETMKSKVASYPKLNQDKKLVNLEDLLKQEVTLRNHVQTDDDVLALSAALHAAAKGEAIRAQAIAPHYANGERLWNMRMGRINLACVHCHEQKVGANMRADVISQAQPTGFPIYRISWQTLGSMDRRLRACYSGVQAPVPISGAPELRDLELFLKVRANGMTIDGPSIRR